MKEETLKKRELIWRFLMDYMCPKCGCFLRIIKEKQYYKCENYNIGGGIGCRFLITFKRMEEVQKSIQKS